MAQSGIPLRPMGSDVETADSPNPYEAPALMIKDLPAAARARGHIERRDGRYVLDPDEARAEYGEEIASRLKLSKDGQKVLWPQPTDSPDDPQNWSDGKKNLMLFIATIAAFVPDFCSALGTATLYEIVAQFHTSPSRVVNFTSTWAIFLPGPGGVMALLFIRKFGRLPVMFWSQVLGLGFQIGCTFAPNLNTLAAMCSLHDFFSSAPIVAGLYTIIDMYPVHLVHRKLTIWTFGFVMSPYMAIWLLGYLADRQNWRWAWAVSSFCSAFSVFIITLFFEETLYDRHLPQIPPRPTRGLRYRMETLLGVTGWKLRKYRTTMWQATIDLADVLWRPHFLPLAILAMGSYGFKVGISVTNPIFFGALRPVGYGFSKDIISTLYLVPIVGVLVGEVLANLFNRYAINFRVKRDKGIYESEDVLIATIVGLTIFVAGMVLFGWTLEHKANIVGVVFGWGMVLAGNVFIIVAVIAYTSASFPSREGECSALLNLARAMGSFAVPYFQVAWVKKDGALNAFGTEGAVVAGLWLLTMPMLFWKGKQIREIFSIKRRDEYDKAFVKAGNSAKPKIVDTPNSERN